MLELFKHKIHGAGNIEFLICGLGNIGLRYEGTRHNAGFMALNYLAEQTGCQVIRNKFSANIGECAIGGKRVLLMKPSTFMNNSGLAVSEAARFYKIPPEKIIVIFDDISLDEGRIRVRRKGSDGGHNGIKSIVSSLNSENFPRIKIGIGKKTHPEMDLADYVLGKFTPKQLEDINNVMPKMEKACELILAGDIDQAMNQCN